MARRCMQGIKKARSLFRTIFGSGERVEVATGVVPGDQSSRFPFFHTCDDDVEDAHLTRRRRHRRHHLSNVANPPSTNSDLLNFFLRPACILSVPRRKTPAIITYLRQLVCTWRRVRRKLLTQTTTILVLETTWNSAIWNAHWYHKINPEPRTVVQCLPRHL